MAIDQLMPSIRGYCIQYSSAGHLSIEGKMEELLKFSCRLYNIDRETGKQVVCPVYLFPYLPLATQNEAGHRALHQSPSDGLALLWGLWHRPLAC